MAQEIMVAGAIYEGVPSVRLPDSHGVFHPFTDTSDTTAVAADVAQGKTFHLADGSAATGTAAGATLVTKSITANGTYDAGDDGADGYSEVTVNVSGGGGGGGGVDPKDVNFIDFDGTVLHAYTAAEFAALTALPENPTHDGLVAQGWNWTLSDAQSYVANYGFLTIGQMYVTASGDTEIDVELYEGTLSPYFGFAVNGTVTIDWGDGSATDTVTGTSLTTHIRTVHDYATAGCYTIKTHVVSGEMALYGTTNNTILSTANKVGYQNQVYTTLVRRVRIGTSTRIGDYAFIYCRGMQTVTIPHGIVGIGTRAFSNCTSLRAITIPDSVTNVSGYAFQQCDSLSKVSLPRAATGFGAYLFDYCYALASIAISDRVTTIGNYTFEQCYSLHEIAIPSSVTSIGTNVFSSCYSLVIVTIPSSVTSIKNNAFSACYGLSELHFKRSTPPSVANSNAFSSLPTDCTIYVPTGSLSAYRTASNYPSASTYTYVEE